MQRLETIMEAGAKALRMCGHGREGNWFVRVADRFFIDCPCCLFWRGAAVGAVVAVIPSILVALLIGHVMTSTPEPVDHVTRADLAYVNRSLATLESRTEAALAEFAAIKSGIGGTERNVNALAQGVKFIGARSEAIEAAVKTLRPKTFK